jgi:hypothetical protein
VPTICWLLQTRFAMLDSPMTLRPEGPGSLQRGAMVSSSWRVEDTSQFLRIQEQAEVLMRPELVEGRALRAWRLSPPYRSRILTP